MTISHAKNLIIFLHNNLPQTKPHALLLGSKLSHGDLDFFPDPKSESRRRDTAVEGPDVELYLLLFRTSPQISVQKESTGRWVRPDRQRQGENTQGIKMNLT